MSLDLKLAVGNLAVELPVDFSADINASVLRLGKVEVAYPNLEPREPNSTGPNSVRARAGSGGATLSFTVGDGTRQVGDLSTETADEIFIGTTEGKIFKITLPLP